MALSEIVLRIASALLNRRILLFVLCQKAWAPHSNVSDSSPPPWWICSSSLPSCRGARLCGTHESIHHRGRAVSLSHSSGTWWVAKKRPHSRQTAAAVLQPSDWHLPVTCQRIHLLYHGRIFLYGWIRALTDNSGNWLASVHQNKKGDRRKW